MLESMQPNRSSKRKDDGGGNSMATLARYLGLATLLPMGAFAGYLCGTYLDEKFGTHYLKLTCIVLFLIGGFIQLIRELMREANRS
jgi:hypothetical protein